MSDEAAPDWSNDRYARAIDRLRVTNAGLAREIEAMGGGVEILVARLEHFMGFLVAEGIISEGQQVREQYAWERGLRDQLITARNGLKEQVEKARAHQREQMRKMQLQQQAQTEEAKKLSETAEPKKDALWVPPGKEKA